MKSNTVFPVATGLLIVCLVLEVEKKYHIESKVPVIVYGTSLSSMTTTATGIVG